MQSQKPSEKILKNLYDGVVINDSCGRKIELKSYDTLDRYYVFRAMGEDANNKACLSHATLILHTKSIDGIVFELPHSHSEVLAILKRIPLESGDAIYDFINNNDSSSEKEENAKIKK